MSGAPTKLRQAGPVGAGQPVVDIMGERLIGVGDIAFDLGLPPVEGVNPRQQPLF